MPRLDDMKEAQCSSKPPSPPPLAASLALVAVLGPAGIDMYQASMPAMARELHTSYANVQLSLSVFLLALGGGQLLCGPLTDMLGRRRPCWPASPSTAWPPYGLRRRSN